MDGPAREIVPAHAGRPHAVEEELEVPDDPGEGREQVVGQQRRRPVEPIPARLVPAAQDQAPDRVRREAAAEPDDHDGEVLEDRGRAGGDRLLGQGLARGEGKGHAGAHDPGEHGHPDPFLEVEFGHRGRGSSGGNLLLLPDPGAAADRDAREADQDAQNGHPARRGAHHGPDPALEDGRDEGAEDGAKAQGDGVAEGHPQVAHGEPEGESAESPQEPEKVGPQDGLRRRRPQDAEQAGAGQEGHDPGRDDPREEAADQPVGLPGPLLDLFVGDVEAPGGETAGRMQGHAEEGVRAHIGGDYSAGRRRLSIGQVGASSGRRLLIPEEAPPPGGHGGASIDDSGGRLSAAVPPPDDGSVTFGSRASSKRQTRQLSKTSVPSFR